MVDQLLAIGTIVLQILSFGFLALYFLRSRFTDLQGVAEILQKYGLWLGFLLALAASAMTLYYSEILGIPPCPLCWWQRIFLYPQVVLFAIALWKRDKAIALYSIVLSALGIVFALYHHILQMFPSSGLPCPAEGVSCAQIFFLEFGYITYPMMALSLFAFLIVLMLFVRSTGNDNLLNYRSEPA
jgi:disulfide bond formation protein DsbB